MISTKLLGAEGWYIFPTQMGGSDTWHPPQYDWYDWIFAGLLSLLDSHKLDFWQLTADVSSFILDDRRNQTDHVLKISHLEKFGETHFGFQQKSLEISSPWSQPSFHPFGVRLAPSESTSIIAKFCPSSECLGGNQMDEWMWMMRNAESRFRYTLED